MSLAVVKIIISLFLLVSLVFKAETTYAQNKVSKDYTLQKTLKQDGLEYQFTVLSSDKRGVLHFDLDRTYYWYKAQKVMGTEGGASGTLLHGEFVAYHSNKQLAQQGRFCKGLKCGTWRYWNEDGKNVKIEKWKRGKEVLPKVKKEKRDKKEKGENSSFWPWKKSKEEGDKQKENKEDSNKKEKGKSSEGKGKIGKKMKGLFSKKDKSEKVPVRKEESKKKNKSNGKQSKD